MAFWGVEVKPGKPIAHSCEKANGRLRISQATLGLGEATKKTVVQCNVGNRAPLLLCALLPSKTESCHLELEFDEADDVIFSVIGPRSVHLTGYYIRQNQQLNLGSDTESYGVDIENSQTEGSSNHSEEDKYEDSFIDDGELQVSPPSPGSSSQEIGKSTEQKDKLKSRKGKLKKKSQVVLSDDEEEDSHSNESEDDDGYLLSVFKSKKAVKKTKNDDEKDPYISEKMDEKAKNDDLSSLEPKETVAPLDINDESKSAKPKRKRKEKIKEETCKIVVVKDQSGEKKGHEPEASKNMELAASCLVSPPEMGSEDGHKSKKRRKELKLEETCEDGAGWKCPKDDKAKKESLLADTIMEDLPPAKGGGHEKIDKNVCKKPEVPDENHPEKKSRKKIKKKKTQEEGNSSMGMPNATTKQDTTFSEHENSTANVTPIDKKTLSNGLMIEVLANGPPNGKVAAPGKKVKIYYTGMLKESGKTFDTNVDKTASKFRLGDQEIIDGWNTGIDGMRVGEKRRLTVPPSMGFGNHGGGENVPPNSWLVYEVELVGVHR